MADTPVTIRGTVAPLMVRRGETILDAALRHGLPYPHSCQGGNCGACKSRLLSGTVDLRPHAGFALTPEERATGLILACRADPKGPCDVAWLDADDMHQHPYRELDCRIAAIDHPAREVTRFSLSVDSGGPLEFSAGQYAELTFAGHPPRDFSMASRPNDLPVVFHVRDRGAGVSRHIARDAGAGDRVHLRGPRGACFLRQLHTSPIIAVAGGTGLAPIWSIVATALAKGMTQPIQLWFGVQDTAHIYMADDLAGLAARHRNFTFRIVVSEPSQPLHHTTGHATGWLHDAIAAAIHDTDLTGSKAYLAGPPPMIAAVNDVLRAAGLAGTDIHADAFTPAA